jgi:hypothetical protein
MEFESGHPHRRTTSIGFSDPRKIEGELLWPERFSSNYLENDLKPMLSSWGGDYAVAAQMQQRPIPRGGGMFQRDKVGFVDAAPDLSTVVRGWDLAASTGMRAPRTVGVKLAMGCDGRVYVLDVARGQGAA